MAKAYYLYQKESTNWTLNLWTRYYERELRKKLKIISVEAINRIKEEAKSLAIKAKAQDRRKEILKEVNCKSDKDKELVEQIPGFIKWVTKAEVNKLKKRRV